MGGTGSFPIDLVLFGMIAAFLVLRLRSILGRRTGYEHPPQPVRPPGPAVPSPVIEGRAEPAQGAAGRGLPDPASPAGQALLRMQNMDRTFSPAGFLNGAENAFRMIVTAFATGDRATLRNLLADETYRAFEAAIAAREAAGQRQRSEIRAIPSVSIIAAEVRGNIGAITVRFVSDQVSLTVDAQGNPVSGTDAVTEITDIWTFERELGSADPAWKLVSAANG
jgi:predicted lipid-binding transport protein (Tim44 family)